MAKTIIPDTQIKKPTYWEGGELKPMRLAGRPAKRKLETTPRSQLVIYNQISKRSQELVVKLFKMSESKNERIKLEAIKILLDKILPNKKAEEFGKQHSPISVFINNQGFVPPDPDVAAPMGGVERPTQIQGARMAPKGEEDFNGDNGDSKASTN